ncbi:Gp23 family protein, partial [Listeria monocytogenes]
QNDMMGQQQQSIDSLSKSVGKLAHKVDLLEHKITK